MFAKNKVSQSLVDAVNKIMSEEEIKSELLNEAEKVPTSTGMKVYGSRYGDSQKARKDQLKTSLDDVKGPSEKDGKLSGGGLYLSKNVKEELKGNQHKIDKNKNNKIDAQDFKMLRKEELKGDQHKIDANKNNKIDAHDFQLLRGKKKVKEDTFAAKLLNSLDEKKETGSSDPLANRQDYAKRHGTGQVYKKTHAGDKTGMTQAFAYDIKRSGPKGKLPEEVELEEAAPKKMDDVAKQNLEPAKKGVVGTVKSDFKNFKNFLAGKKETNEEVESLDEDRYLMKYLLSRGINPEYVDRNTKVGHAKSNEFKKWKSDHLNSLIVTRESNEMPFDGPYTKTKKDVKDKSGAVHTPMSRAKDLARSALKSVQDKTKIK